MSHGHLLLIYAVLAILALIVLIARYRLNPFISVTVVSVGLALLAGMPAPEILPAYEQGVGKTLGHIALIVALGTMLGKMMAESGGAERIARTLIARFGTKNVHWAMMLIAFCIGLPIFFEVGFVLLVPIALNVARRTGVPLLLVGLPMVAGLSVVHGLVPPHPAAMLAVHAYGADVGRTVFYALLVGLPTAALAGPLFARVVAPRVKLPARNPMEAALLDEGHGRIPDDQLPGFGITIAWTVCTYFFLVTMPTYAVRQLGVPQSASFLANSVGLVLIVVLAPVFGAWSDKVGRRPIMLAAACGILLSCWPLLFWLTHQPSVVNLVLAQIVFAVLIAGFSGPAPAAMAELYPPAMRSTGLSIAYNLAVTIFGGFAPFITTWLIVQTGSSLAPAWYVMLAAAISLTTLTASSGLIRGAGER